MAKTLEKKTLNDLYNEAKQEPTPAQRFISEVAELTKRSEQTVRMWLSGVQIPDPNVTENIARHFNVDPESLFANC